MTLCLLDEEEVTGVDATNAAAPLLSSRSARGRVGTNLRDCRLVPGRSGKEGWRTSSCLLLGAPILLLDEPCSMLVSLAVGGCCKGLLTGRNRDCANGEERKSLDTDGRNEKGPTANPDVVLYPFKVIPATLTTRYSLNFSQGTCQVCRYNPGGFSSPLKITDYS